MTSRIPSSLKWLVTKYQQQQRTLLETEKLLCELSTKKSELLESTDSLKRVIDIHEVPITSSDIPKLRKNTKRTKLPYGLVTKLIYEYLRQLPEEKEATVSEVFSFCVQKIDTRDFSAENLKIYRLAVRKRLQNMAYKGQITRTRIVTKSRDGKFKIK